MKQANGRGSVVYDKERHKYRAHFTTPAGRRISKRFDTNADAAAWLTTQQSEVLNNTYCEPSKMTLGSWLVTWLQEYKKSAVSVRTYELYSMLIKKCSSLSGIPLQKLTAPQIQQLYNNLLTKLSANTVNKVHKVLHAALKKAVLVDMLAKNPVDAVESPKFKKKNDIETFSREEIEKLYNTAKTYANGRYFPFIVLAVTTGARRGELLALRWQDINFETCEISITRNLQQTDTQGIVISEPKTQAGRRIVSVPKTVTDILKQYQRENDVISMSGLIFISRTGTPMQPRNVEHRWRMLVKNAGIPYRNFHVLRHTHATDLLAHNIPIVEVARRLGHARVSHTLDLYAHAIPRYDKGIADKVAELYGTS